MVTVWLIRHAESESNAGYLTQHPAATQITAKGRQQSQQIARFIPSSPSLIVTSPYIRTQQTAEPTIQRFPTVPQTEWQIQEFTFLAPVHYKNTTVDQRRPMADVYWQRCDPFYVDGDGAESFAELVQRVRQFRSQVEQLEDGFVVAFSHGRFIRTVLWVLLANPTEMSTKTMQQFQHFSDSFQVANGAILKMQFCDSEVWLSSLITAQIQNLFTSEPPT